MDGAAFDFIVIPIVAIICLATWLGGIYWADSHPRWGPRATTVTREPEAIAGRVPAPRQPVVLPPQGAGEGSRGATVRSG